MKKNCIMAGIFPPKNELFRYACNIFATKEILQDFEFSQEFKRSGLLLTDREKEERASITLERLLDSNLIQNGLIVPGMLEYVVEQIA